MSEGRVAHCSCQAVGVLTGASVCFAPKQHLADYLWAPAPPMPEAKVADYQNGHAAMRSAFQTQPSDNGRKVSGFYGARSSFQAPSGDASRKLSMGGFYGAPIAANSGGLHSRPSYMGELPPQAGPGMPAALAACMPPRIPCVTGARRC